MKTILLVDDDLLILEVLEEILKILGYKVISRRDAVSALSLLREGTRIDLVITDYRMPGMNGVEFLTVLRQIVPSVPVIILTGHGSVEVYLKSLNLGAFEYLNKPVEVKALNHSVKSALERSSAGNVLLPS